MSLSHLTVLLAYALAASILAFALRSERDESIRMILPGFGVAAGVLAALLHGRHLWQSVFAPEGWLPSLFNVVSMIGWELGLLAVLATAIRELRVIALPLFLLAGTASLLTDGGNSSLGRVRLSPEIMLHIVLSLLAYGLLAGAALLAVFLWLQNRWLRHGHVRGWISMLPPLFVTERLLFMMLSLGWLLLTFSLTSGFVLLEGMFSPHMLQKTVRSLTGWAILTVLLGGHLLWGWRGRRITLWALSSCALLLIAYFGSKALVDGTWM